MKSAKIKWPFEISNSQNWTKNLIKSARFLYMVQVGFSQKYTTRFKHSYPFCKDIGPCMLVGR
jgi:hypothetical protein